LIQQFLENAAEVKGEKPLSLPAGSEILCALLMRTEKRVRKAIAFRGRTNKTVLPFWVLQKTTVLKMFRWNIFNERMWKSIPEQISFAY
jgi:hypothetical protein